MRPLRIVRIGGVGQSKSRFIDFLSHPDVEAVTFVIPRGQSLDELIQALQEDAPHLGGKLKVIEAAYNRYVYYLYREFIATRVRYLLSDRLLGWKHFEKEIQGADIVWVGDSHSDGSNHLLNVVKRYHPTKVVIRSFKETRFTRKRDEELALMNADWLILPNDAYALFFRRLYGIDISQKMSISDINYRYSRQIEYVQGIASKKYSEVDGKVHVCILTGLATWSESEPRAGSRYYYVDMIIELLHRGMEVHLHASSIVKRRSLFRILFKKLLGREVPGRNRYRDLVRLGLHIERPLRLTMHSRDYEILKRYDAGIMHNEMITGANRSVSEFEKINVANRLFEYQMSDVLPIIRRGTSPETERIIRETDFGVIYEDYDDLKEKLLESRNRRMGSVRSYMHFTEEFVKVARAQLVGSH